MSADMAIPPTRVNGLMDSSLILGAGGYRMCPRIGPCCSPRRRRAGGVRADARGLPPDATGSRSLVVLGGQLQGVALGLVMVDPQRRSLSRQDLREALHRGACLLRSGVQPRHAPLLPVRLEVDGVAGQIPPEGWRGRTSGVNAARLLRGVTRRPHAEGQADPRADSSLGLGDPVRVVQLRLVAHDEETPGLEVDVEDAPRRLL